MVTRYWELSSRPQLIWFSIQVEQILIGLKYNSSYAELKHTGYGLNVCIFVIFSEVYMHLRSQDLQHIYTFCIDCTWPCAKIQVIIPKSS